MAGNIHRIAYHTPVRAGRALQPNHMRDGDGAIFVTGALYPAGYTYAGPIFNYPYRPPKNGLDLRRLDPQDIDPAQLDQTDERRVGKGDLLLLSTRPPMDDHVIGNRRCIKRSFTSLEHRLFEGPLRSVFKTCARSEIVLTSAVTRNAPDLAHRQSMMFYQNGRATYQSCGSPSSGWQTFPCGPRDEHVTAAFLVYAQEAWPDGPALLAAFGMGGTDTLGWCALLATRFKHLLCTTPFAMAEIRSRPQRKHPTSMDFVDSWDVTILGAEPVARKEPVRAA